MVGVLAGSLASFFRLDGSAGEPAPVPPPDTEVAAQLTELGAQISRLTTEVSRLAGQREPRPETGTA